MILGIDPSLSNTGISIYDPKNEKCLYVSNIISPHSDWYSSAIYISEQIGWVAKKYNVMYVAMESLYVGINRQTVLKLGILWGKITSSIDSNAPQAYISEARMTTIKSALGIKDEKELRYLDMWGGKKKGNKYNGSPIIKDSKISIHNYIFDNKIWNKPIDDNAADAIIIAYTYSNHYDRFESIIGGGIIDEEE